jgi:bla regulator protein BlaR1
MILSVGEVFLHLAAPLANHLWQSTVFGLVAACVTLLLRKNAARFRFFIWFLASVKFLLPFSFLVFFGSLVGPRASAASQRNFVSIVEIAGQPFGQSAGRVLNQPRWWDQLSGMLPPLIGTLWIAGTFAVFLVWWLRWLQVSCAKRAATPICRGPEVDLLRLLKPATGTRPVTILLSEGHVEPGVFGIFRPVLLWPTNISKELSEPQLRAILAHEVWHIRRNDNLTAAVQMFIEALFWFHPLVWWFGSRQMEERERACDEGVLGLGGAPAVYAEGILKTCKFCVEAPLPCVAGVNGSDLKKRITRIMNMQDITTLSQAKKLVLSTLAIGAVGVPVLLGVASSPKAGAQATASAISSGPLHITAVKRNVSGNMMTQIKRTAEGTSVSNTTVRNLIQMAYSVKSYQLTGGPAWIDQDRFDITYTGGEPSGASRGLVSNAALKEVLAERFHLVLRQETKPGPVFALVVGDGGAKLATVTPQNAPGTDEPLLSMRVMEEDGQGQIAITGGPGGLAESLSSQVGRPIIDKTGLTGIYNINFHWATASASADSISSDLQQQLGLSLVPQEGPVETSVIDSVAIPTGR